MAVGIMLSVILITCPDYISWALTSIVCTLVGEPSAGHMCILCMSVGFNRGAQTPLVDYSKAMVCLLYGTKGYPVHIVTGSTGRGYNSVTLFCFDVCYSFAKNYSIFRKKKPIRSAFQETNLRKHEDVICGDCVDNAGGCHQWRGLYR